jgi:DNA (cytosine-5)-methyltransferase 1
MMSLFAGAGGLDIGLEQAGFTTRVINELESHACETLRQNKRLSSLRPENFPAWFDAQMQQRCYAKISAVARLELFKQLSSAVGSNRYLHQADIIEGDIRGISTQELLQRAGIPAGQLTLIAGGPPCQPFSRAGKRETVESDDGKLFLEFVRIVDEARPRWILFENVKGLAQSRTLVPFIQCPRCKTKTPLSFSRRPEALDGALTHEDCPACARKGCEIEIEDVRGGSLDIILNEFKRIGYQCHHRLLNAADFGVPQSRERLIIVGSRDGEAFEWPEPTHRSQKLLASDTNPGQMDLLSPTQDHSPLKPWETVRDTLWQHGHPEFKKLDPAKAVIWVKNVVRPHDEPVYWTLDRPSPTVGAHQAAKLCIAPEGVPAEQLARQQWHTRGHRQKDLPPVHFKHAYLSDIELLALQTFPVGWYLYGTRMERAFQIGNAVPPKLAQAVGLEVIKACIKTGKTNTQHAPAWADS